MSDNTWCTHVVETADIGEIIYDTLGSHAWCSSVQGSMCETFSVLSVICTFVAISCSFGICI